MIKRSEDSTLQLWICKLDFNLEQERFNRLLRAVSAEKKNRILRFVRKEDAYRTLFAERLLRHALGTMYHLPETDMIMDTTSHGKPYLVSRPDIHFNLTHSGHWVGCALDTLPVGVDIEEIQPISLQIADRFFSAEENKWLRTMPADHQMNGFYDLWTLKESYIKAVGQGLSIPLDSFSILPLENEVHAFQVLQENCRQPYMCRSYELEDSYKMSVCRKGERFPSGYRMVDFAQLCEVTE